MFIWLISFFRFVIGEIDYQRDEVIEKLECLEGVWVQGICLGYCPSGFEIEGSECLMRSPLILDFSESSSLPNLSKVPFSSLISGTSIIFSPVHTEEGLAISNSTMILNKQKISLSPVFTLELKVLPLSPGTITSDSSGNIKVWVSQSLNKRTLSIKTFSKTTVFDLGFQSIHLVLNVKRKKKSMELKIMINENRRTEEISEDFDFFMEKIDFFVGGELFVGLFKEFRVFNHEKFGKFEKFEKIEICQNLQSSECLMCFGNNCFLKCCQMNEEKHRKLEVVIENLKITSKTTCPIFYYQEESSTTCLKSNKKAMIFSFDTLSDTISDGGTINKLIPSSEQALYGVNRGRYFNGVTNFYTLQSNITYFYLQSCFSFWIRPDHLENIGLFSGDNFDLSINYLNAIFSYTPTSYTGTMPIIELKSNQWFFISFLIIKDSSTFKIKAMKNEWINSINSTDSFFSSSDTPTLEGSFYVGKGQRLFKGWMFLFLASLDNEIRFYLPMLSFPCSVQSYSTHACPETYELGYFFNKTSNQAELCGENIMNCRSFNDCNFCADPACINCGSGKYFECLTCFNYRFKGYCYDSCPILTEADLSGNCSKINQIRLVQFNGAISSNHSSLSFISIEGNAPRFIPSRGIFFSSSSFVSSVESYFMMPELNQGMWIKIITSGKIAIGFFHDYFDEIYSFIFDGFFLKVLGINVLVNEHWTAISKRTVENIWNVFHPQANLARLYTQYVQVNGTIKEIFFYDNSTTLSRIRMSFKIKTDLTATFLLYNYGYSDLNYYNMISNEFSLNGIDSGVLSVCNLMSYVSAGGCVTCNCIGCLDDRGCLSTCPLNCVSCSLNALDKCTSCFPGYYLFNGICIRGCPLLFNDLNGVCFLQEGSPQYVEWDFNTLNMNSTNSTISMLAAPGSTFQYKRGWYTKRIDTSSFIISPIFQLAAWVKLPEKVTFINRVSSFGTELSISVDISQYSISILTFNGLIKKSFTRIYPEYWINLKISAVIQNSLFSIEFKEQDSPNQFESTPSSQNFFKSSNQSTTIFGDFINSFWVYKIGLNQNSMVFDFEYSYIDTWFCGIGKYQSIDECFQCSPSCTTCRFSTNCSICYHPLCRNCEKDTELSCNSCAENARREGDICVCRQSFYQLNENCYPCQPLCVECSSQSPNTCISCASGASMDNDGKCFCDVGMYSRDNQCWGCQVIMCADCTGTNGNTCTRCRDRFYLNNGFCSSCSSQCATCTDGTYLGCSTCAGTLNELCTHDCPNYYEKILDSFGKFSCNPRLGNSFLLEFNRLNNPFTTTDPNLSFNYKENNALIIPKIAYARGILMNSLSTLNSATSFMFSNKFTIQFLVKPEKGSVLNVLNRFSLGFYEKYITLNGVNLNSEEKNIDFNSWVLITMTYEASASNGVYNVWLENELLGTRNIPHFLDTKQPIVILRLNNNFYQGWIYRIQYLAYLLETNQYLNIRADIEIWTCSLSMMDVSGECKPCLSQCSTCRYVDTCTLCSSPNCAACDNFSSYCSRCIEKGDINTHNCSCLQGYARNKDKCESCHNSCTSCTTITHLGCSTCKFNLNQKCTSVCPYLYTEQNPDCLSIGHQKFNIDFNRFLTSTTKLNTDILSDFFNIIQTSPVAQATPSQIFGYKRGLYLKTLYLESIIPLLLSNIFSIKSWVHPYTTGVFLYKPKLGIEITDINVIIKIVLEGGVEKQVNQNKACLNTWNLLTLTVDIDGDNVKISLFLNEERQDTSFPGSFLDIDGNLMISTATSTLRSWVYSFTYSITSLENNDDFLSIIPTLWPCFPEEYYEGNTCKKCMLTCLTCRYSDTCSLCSNILCDSCDSFDSTSCKKCSPEATYAESNCVCPEGKVNFGSKCLPCHPACKTCNDASYSSCTSCYITLNHFCTVKCPLFYKQVDTSCIASEMTSARIIFNQLDGIFQTENPDLSFFSASKEPPLIGYLRGVYFNGSQLTGPEFSMFSNIFSISMWINSRSLGRVLEKPSFFIETSRKKLSISITLQNQVFSFSLNNNFNIDTWSFLFVSVKSEQGQPLTISIRQDTFFSEEKVNDYYLDSPSSFSIGSGIIGWIYSFNYWSEAVNFNDLSDVLMIGSFLWNCRPFYYFNGKSCSACPNLCNCRRPNDCRPCNDEYCDVCSNSESTCLRCMEKSIWVEESGKCARCLPRYEGCSYLMESDQNCIRPFFKNYDGTCLSYCGDGDLSDDWKCNRNDVRVFSFTFNRVSNVITSGKYQMYMGLDDSFWPKYDNLDPFLLYKRGLYFNRSSATLGTPQKPSTLRVSNTHTFELFLNPLNPGQLLSLSDEKFPFISLSHQITSKSPQLFLSYMITDTFSSSNLNHSSPITPGLWYHFRWSLDFTSNKLTLRTYLNNEEIEIKAEINSIFNQPLTSYFFLGGRIVSSFTGYIYRVSFFNFLVNNFDPLDSCSGSECLEMNEFLSSCLFNEFSGPQLRCGRCRVECLTGCSSEVNCNIHPDPLCKTFQFLNENCTQCVDGSVSKTFPCVCAEGADYDIRSNSCRCPGIQKIYQDKCDNCTRWLQQGEVSGYFDNSFMQVIINFEVPVIKVPCKALFNESVIFKLGAGFSCIFSENLKVLTIVLGKGNTLKEETISFLEKSLIGTRQECGFNSTFVSVSLKFSAEFPTPKAIISVPDTILLNCQNLTVDGSLSTGKLLDDLQYQWEFVLNDKEIPELSKKGISIYPIPRDLLEEGTILITLTVKNRFDYQDSTTSKVLLTTENKITVLFEQVNENSCKQSSPCQFSIKSIDTCSKNPLFNYSWKLKNQKEISADFDKFWALQTVPTSVKIPENFFLPGILKFELTVTETLSKAESISQLNVKILPSDLIISTDRIGGFVSSLEDLTISSSILNPLPENTNFQFTWECFLLGRPCKFQFTNNKSIVTIPRTFLQSQALDKLVLTVTLNYQLDQETSEFISSSLSLALKIVSWKVAKVQIVEALTSTEKRVFKISEKLTFKAIYEETDVFSFSWRVEGKDSIFITPTDQVYIGIDPSGLIQGESYKLVLEMTSESGSSSEYYYDFTMNSPPKFGIFSVTPNEGTELETEFYFITNDWQDTEKNYPLLYNFGYIQENTYFILIPTSISNSAKLILPYKGEKLTVFTKVFDSLGDYSEETLTVTIKKQDQSKIDEFLKKTSNSLNQVRFDLLPNVLSNILSASLNRRSDTETFPELDTKLQETLSLIQEKASSLIELSMASPELIDLTSSLLQDLTQNPNLRSEENLNKTTQLIHQLLNQTDHLGLTKDQAENLLDSVDNSVKMKLSALYNQTASMDSLHQVLNNLNSGMMKKMIPGQKNQLETNQMTMQSLVFNDYASGAQLKTEGLASVNVPSEVFQQMAGGLKIGMHFSTVKLDSTGESESVPDVLSISVFQEGLLKDVSLKTSKFLLEVPVVSVETVKKPACVFLNESYQWDSFGCTVVEVKTFSIICECSHLSFFSAGEGTEGGGFFPSNNFAQTTDFKSLKDLNATSALGFYVCGTLLVAYVIIAILVGSKDAEDMKEIIKQIDNQNVLKVVEAQEQSLHISQNDEAIMVDSDIAEGEMLDPKKEENIIIKARVRIKNLIHNHKFLRIFFLFDPNAFRLSTCTMIFTVLIGKMYFIGLFYDGGGGEEATTIREAISGYTFRDFLVMVYSTVIMFCIEVVVAYLTKNNPVNIKWSKDENVRIIKQNRWRRIGCLAFCWPLMIWFSWSIAMFAMNLDISVSYKWIVTTVTGYIGDFFFMPGFEYLLMKWIFPNLGVILQIRVCFYKCFEKRKKRKVESESMDELGSREGTEKPDIR